MSSKPSTKPPPTSNPPEPTIEMVPRPPPKGIKREKGFYGKLPGGRGRTRRGGSLATESAPVGGRRRRTHKRGRTHKRRY
jgi:hypothetical protein